MLMFDWCVRDQHNACREKVQRFTYERNRVVWLDEYHECECTCHKKKKTSEAQQQPSPES